jgi:putative hydrolase of the HAD superfamily
VYNILMLQNRFHLIGFDADDTLWHNERLYHDARARFRAVLAACGAPYEEDDIDERVNETELRNLEFYGYGISSFVLSLIETSIELTSGRISGTDVRELIQLSKEMLAADVELFDDAADTLARVGAVGPLMLITKGDLLHQRAKVQRSGLADYFRYVEVVSHKTEEIYAGILQRHGVDPSRFLMIGNSVRSDILPVLQLGGWAIHIPAALSWSHEHADVPDALKDRCLVVDRLAVLPAVIGRLRQSSAAAGAGRD